MGEVGRWAVRVADPAGHGDVLREREASGLGWSASTGDVMVFMPGRAAVLAGGGLGAASRADGGSNGCHPGPCSG
ncbi:hypothetical protein [Dactylosporangium sp. CA-139066]|uniref:hypothetical protein n=1 Tax=Dactylosporangium sp. CA-139066 TaxID=3239930 RepID=UPI003D926A8B